MCSYTHKWQNAADILLPFSSVMGIIQYNFYCSMYPQALRAGSTLNWQKHTQNINRTETVQRRKWNYCERTHTPYKTQTVARRFSVLFCPHSADSCSEVKSSCSASSKMKKNTYAWLRLALYSSHQKFQKKKSEAFLGEVNSE